MPRDGVLLLIWAVAVVVILGGLIWWGITMPHCIEYTDGTTLCRVVVDPTTVKYYYKDTQ